MNLTIDVSIDKDRPLGMGDRGRTWWEWEVRVNGRGTYGECKDQATARAEVMREIERAVSGA